MSSNNFTSWIHTLLKYFYISQKTFLPKNFASLSRFGNSANLFFEALLSLGDSETEVIKIRNALGNLRRAPGEPISSILVKVDSLYTALYAMSQPQKLIKKSMIWCSSIRSIL